jgi:hypothetical protein
MWRNYNCASLQLVVLSVVNQGSCALAYVHLFWYNDV